jgi:hypothetical protein
MLNKLKNPQKGDFYNISIFKRSFTKLITLELSLLIRHLVNLWQQ